MKFCNFFLLTKWKCKKLLIGDKVKINKNAEINESNKVRKSNHGER